MRTSIIATSLALASFAAAQTAGDLPVCAQKCLEPFASPEGIAGCNPVDIGCICGSGAFIENISCCLSDECSAADQQAAISFAGSICKSAGVTVPTEIKCEKPAGTTSSTVESKALSSIVSSAVSSASSELSESSSRSASSGATAASTTTAAGGAATSAASAASSAAATGAAGRATIGGSGVLGGILAALAVL